MGQEKLKNKKTRSIGVRKTQEFANSTQVVDSEKALQALSSAELGGEFQVYPDEETGNFSCHSLQFEIKLHEVRHKTASNLRQATVFTSFLRFYGGINRV